MPTKLSAFIERTNNGLDFHAETSLTNPNDADALVRKIGDFRKEGIAELRQAMKQPLPPGSPPIPFQDFINILETAQLQSKGDRIQLRATVSDNLIQQLGSVMSGYFSLREFEEKQ